MLDLLFLILLFQEIERITIRNRVLEEQQAKIHKYFKCEVVNQIFVDYLKYTILTFNEFIISLNGAKFMK